MNRSLIATAALVAATLVATAAPASAADVAPSGGRVVTMTRGMKIFGDAENALVAALAAKDEKALDALLDPSFEQRGGDAPGTPLPRDEWIADAIAHGDAGDRFSQMAVHDQGDFSIVSMLMTRAKGRGDAFVVDVWKRDGNQQVLVLRYLSAAAMPGAGPAHGTRAPAPRRASAPVVDTKR